MSTVTLVSCVKSKRNAPAPARDLYTSPWFRAAKSYAEASGLPWYILSAEYHLLEPDSVRKPYDKTLHKMTEDERRTWADNVARDLLNRHPNAHAEILAGARYREHLIPLLKRAGWTVATPLAQTRGLGTQIRQLRTMTGRHSTSLTWSGPYRVGELLGKQEIPLPPVDRHIYLVSATAWNRTPTRACEPLYIGGNTTEGRVRNRIGELLFDVRGFSAVGGDGEPRFKQARHSGGKKLYAWARQAGRSWEDLWIGWATRPEWCGRCEEIEAHAALQPILNAARPSRCNRHGQALAPKPEPAPVESRHKGSRADLAGLRRADFERALAAIDAELRPGGRYAAGYGLVRGTRYELRHNGRTYPPKLVVRLAADHAGIHGSLYGGEQVNAPLRRAGFLVAERDA